MITLKFGNQSRLQLLSNCLKTFRNTPQELRDEHARLSRLRNSAAKSKLSRILSGGERFLEQERTATASQNLRRKSAAKKLNTILAKHREDSIVLWLNETRRSRDRKRTRYTKPAIGDAPRAKWQKFINIAPKAMQPHVSRLYEAWWNFNCRFFKGQLSVPRIVVKSLDTALGTCGQRKGQTVITMAREFFDRRGINYQARSHGTNEADSWRLASWVLLHEQCHQAVQEDPHRKCDSHGDTFTREANRVGTMLKLPHHKPTYAGPQSAYWPHVDQRKIPELFPLAQTAAAA